MENLTIKLLHERKTRRPHRKCDGYSGKLYPFTWNDQHSAYCYTTSSQEEADDLFNSQGRQMGSYFAPVITIGAAPRHAEVVPASAPSVVEPAAATIAPESSGTTVAPPPPKKNKPAKAAV